MKRIIFFLFIIFSVVSSRAQDRTTEFSHYVFSEFMPGEVLMKNERKNIVSINYNSLSEEMIFENNGQKLAIADNQLEQIDTVFIDNRKFVPKKGVFFELISSSKPELYKEHKCRLKYPGKVNGPGGRTSQTSSSETYSPTDFRRLVYEVVLPNGYDTSPYQYYWLEKGDELRKIKSLKHFLKLYPSKKNEYKAYKSEHKIDFGNSASVLKLVQFLESN